MSGWWMEDDPEKADRPHVAVANLKGIASDLLRCLKAEHDLPLWHPTATGEDCETCEVIERAEGRIWFASANGGHFRLER